MEGPKGPKHGRARALVLVRQLHSRLGSFPTATAHMHQRAEGQGQGPTLQSLLSGVALLLLPASRWASLSAKTLRGRGGSSR